MVFVQRALMACAVLAAAAMAAPPFVMTDPVQAPPPVAAWAKPSKAPPIRALAICPHPATRDLYALAAHLDMKLEIIPTYSERVLNYEEDPSGRMDLPDLLKTDQTLVPKLSQKYDLIIVAAFNLGDLPGEARYLILKQTAEGAGLLLANQNLAALGRLRQPLLARPEAQGAGAAPGVPWLALSRSVQQETNPFPGVRYRETTRSVQPVYENLAVIEKVAGRYRAGKGRVVVLNFDTRPVRRFGCALTPQDAYPLDRLFQYDYCLSAAAKLARWAARGAPDCAVAAVTPCETRVDRARLGQAASVSLTAAAPAAGPAEARVMVRDGWGRVVHESRTGFVLKPGDQTVPLPLPPLAAGETFLDTWILRDGAVLDWGSSRFFVIAPQTVKLSLEAACLGQGAPLRGVAEIKDAAQGMTLEIRARDSYDRVFALRRFSLAPGQRRQDFDLALADPIGILFHAEAVLLSEGQALCQDRAEFTLPKRLRSDRFLSIGWAGPSSVPASIERFRLLRQYGYDASLSGHATEEQVRAAAWCDLAVVPYMIRLMSCDAETCFTTEEWKTQHRQGLEAHARMVSKYGALGYSLGDEVKLTDYICDSPTCAGAFRAWLRGVYRDAAAMNREWGSAFKSFDAVQPAYVAESKAKSHWPPVMDYMSHRRDLWVEQCRLCHDAIQRGDPGARMGYEGAQGYDRWPELLDFFRIAGPYDWPDNDIVYDRRAPDTITGSWIGSYGNYISEDRARYASWRRLILGGNSQWWWTLAYAFNGDNTPVRRFGANLQAQARIQSGVDTLVLACDFERDPVVLPHCPASELAAKFHFEFGLIESAKDSARAILGELGLRHWRTPSADFARDALEKSGRKVALLPYQQAMKPEEASGLKRFVESGGLLIADVRPVVMNEHGRLLDQGLLDEVFGVIRPQAAGFSPAKGAPRLGPKPGAAAALAAFEGELSVEPGLALRPGAEALGHAAGAPILIVNRVGRGRAVLLNFALGDYLKLRAEGRGAPIRALLAALLESADVRPRERVVAGDGGPPDGFRLARWSRGPLRLLAVDRDPISQPRNGPVRVQIRWAEPGQLYDLMEAKSLGRADRLDAEIHLYRPRLLAWAPSAVEAVEIQAPAKAAPGQRVSVAITVRAAGGPRALSAVLLDVTDARGRWRHELRQRLLVSDQAASAVVPIEINAPAGSWALRATDAASGKSAEHRLVVEP